MKDRKKLAESLEKYGKQSLVDEFKTFFKENPNVDAVRWSQYTPHFNDGDACVFSRGRFKLRGSFAEHLISAAEVDEEGFYPGWDHSSKTELSVAVQKLNDVFAGTDIVFEAAFGDGVQVIATREAFLVENYDHD